jgi:hypothetical protein
MTQPCHEVNVKGGLTVEPLRVRFGPAGLAAERKGFTVLAPR